MLLAGLWHGANWNFVIWGGLQGIVLASESAYHRWNKDGNKNISLPQYLLQVTLTLGLFVFLGTLFRSQDMDKALTLIQNMLIYSEKGLRPYMLKIGLTVIATVMVSNIAGYYIFEKNKSIQVSPVLEFGFYTVSVLLISLLTNDNTAPFIYFQF